MDLKVNSLKSETSCTDLVSHDGYSLRINAFFAWLRRSGYTLEYIAERLATTPDDIVLRLRRREKIQRKRTAHSHISYGRERRVFRNIFSVVQIP